jgi:hypothetical protein
MDIIVTRRTASPTGARNQVGKEVYLFSKTSRTALESTRSPIRLVPDRGVLLTTHLYLILTLRMSAFKTYITASLPRSRQKCVVENMAVHTVTTTSSRVKQRPPTQVQISNYLIIWIV